jgi:predicted phage terminase large subunit-like protein
LQAAGVGGALTGSGAHLFIVDDPFKNREEAESEKRREYVWDFWTSTAYTRLENSGAVVGMLTRWHGDDWAGRLIKAMASGDPKADRYVVICLPAIWEKPDVPEGVDKEHPMDFETYQREQMREGIWVEQDDLLGRKPGEALWPQKYDVEDLERIQANVGPYDWAALYQQRPYLRQGSFFRREWFAIVEAPPKPEEVADRIRYWDKAGTKTGQGGDYAAGVLMSVTHDGIYYVEDVFRRQCTPGERDDEMVRTAEVDQRRAGVPVSIWHQQDPGSAGLDSAQATNRLLSKRGFVAYFEPVTGDKEVRAGPWSSMCQGGAVRLVRGGWNQAFIEEHVAFPKGNHDDQVDAAAGAFGKLSAGSANGGIHV